MTVKKGPDVEAYVESFKDIPGTLVYTADLARKGYQMNQFAMSLLSADNRKRWLSDERTYIDEWDMTEEQKQAILDRDYGRCLELGANIYYLAHIFSSDGVSFLQAVGTQSGMGLEAYKEMMLAGGRSPEGVRSIKENR